MWFSSSSFSSSSSASESLNDKFRPSLVCYFLLKYLIDLIRKDCKTSFNWLILIDKMCRLKMHLQHDDACDDLDGGGLFEMFSTVQKGTPPPQLVRWEWESARTIFRMTSAWDGGDEVTIMLMLPIMRCDGSLLGMIFFSVLIWYVTVVVFFLLLHCWRLFLHFFATSGVGLSLVCNGCG